ncbi:restriction endonuclease subunit S [Campylobacter volucris]|uniref:restriction endonuclease subunit S n=1 Tax=Campylobacter volucris TaxID=1031542 RepID=UPI0018A0B3F5|nr:restriction endonuclease subunit S [Campylobacter volucris]MBF7066834.1 restriction endonuclease subunit S [Campylobacter volucris]
MSKFTKVKLKDCATFINGMAFKPIDWDVKGLPIVRIQNLTGTNKNFNYYSKEYNPKFEINNGDLLISWSASLGVFIWNDGKAILNQHIFKVVFDKIEINKKYFYFCILDVLEEMSEKTHGSAMRHITKGDFDNIEIPLPPLQEQERIVGILDESFANIDESIKNLEQDLLNLDELMQSVLQKAFNPLKDTTKENYQLPQGWEWKSLGEICEINPRNKVDDEINISFISMDKILDGYNNKFSYVIKKWKDVKKGFTHFKQGDIGLAKITPCFENKKSVIFNNLENGIGAGTTELHIIRVGNHIISKFLLWFFKTEKFIKNGILNMTGATGHKRVPKDFIKNLQIPLPPLQEQEQIASYLDELSLNIKDLKQNYQAQIKNLQELKKSLLDRAFKGRL